MTNLEKSVKYLFSKVKDIKQQFGTLTDTTVLLSGTVGGGEIQAAELSENDLVKFRMIVRKGLMKSAEFRPPHGYKILGFLIYLRRIQQAQYTMRVKAQNQESVDALTLTWMNARKTEGSWEAAKKKMAALWGNTEMDSNTRLLFNKAYKAAKTLWEVRK